MYTSGNVDYVETQLNLTFPSGSSGGDRLSFSIPIIDDNVAEHFEFFRVTASANNVEPGLYSSTTYSTFIHISDNDRECFFIMYRYII